MSSYINNTQIICFKVSEVHVPIACCFYRSPLGNLGERRGQDNSEYLVGRIKYRSYLSNMLYIVGCEVGDTNSPILLTCRWWKVMWFCANSQGELAYLLPLRLIEVANVKKAYGIIRVNCRFKKIHWLYYQTKCKPR